MMPSAEELQAIKTAERPLDALCAWSGVDPALLAATKSLLGNFVNVRVFAGIPRPTFWTTLLTQPAQFVDGPPA